MAKFKFANRASALITSAIGSTDLILHVEVGGGGFFPSLGTGEVARCALISTTAAVEYIDVTLISGDTLTIQRAKEGTAAQAFAVGSRIEQRVTANVLDNLLQKTGDAMNGPLDMQGYGIRNAIFDANVKFTDIGVHAIRAFDVDLSLPPVANEAYIMFPGGVGQVPRLFNKPLVWSGLLEQLVFMAYIDLNNIPSYLKLCDGTNATPDLRARFIKGASNFGEPVGTTHDLYGFTGSAGSHAHGGATQLTTLSAANLPPLVVSTVTQNRDVQSGNDFFRITSSRADYSGGANHQHNINAEPDHFHTVDPQPNYYCLAFVMFRTDL